MTECPRQEYNKVRIFHNVKNVVTKYQIIAIVARESRMILSIDGALGKMFWMPIEISRKMIGYNIGTTIASMS